MTRFVVCGEALIDLVPADGVGSDSFRSTWEALSAGGPMNTAVALAKLGADTQFLGRLSSTDSFGRQLRDHLEGAGVGLDLTVQSAQATSLAVVDLSSEGRATYTFHFGDTANFGWQPQELPDLDDGDWLHIASLASVISPGAEVLLEWVQGARGGLSFDINVRPTVIEDPAAYWSRVRPWLEAAGRRGGIVKASDEDVEFLAQATGGPRQAVDAAASWVADFGFSLAVVTLGADGGVAIEPGDVRTQVPGYSTKVVDTVGAGDTFMAGFLDGRIRLGQDLRGSLRRAAAAAAVVCARQGAQPPTAEEVEQLMAEQGS